MEVKNEKACVDILISDWTSIEHDGACRYDD
jgi:hypothetical protein